MPLRALGKDRMCLYCGFSWHRWHGGGWKWCNSRLMAHLAAYGAATSIHRTSRRGYKKIPRHPLAIRWRTFERHPDKRVPGSVTTHAALRMREGPTYSPWTRELPAPVNVGYCIR